MGVEDKRAANAAYRAAKDPVVLAHADCRARAFRGRKRGWKEDAAWWKIPVEVYAPLVGSCYYCGDPALSLSRVSVEGVWEPSNVVCACAVCAKMKTGLDQGKFIDQAGRIAAKKRERGS